MMIGALEILILLLVLGVGGAIVATVVGALVSSRQGAALVLGGLVFLGLLLGAGLLFALVGYRAVGHVSATPAIGVGPGMMTLSERANYSEHTYSEHTTWSFFGGIFLAAAIIAILVFGARRHAAVAHAAAGHHRFLPFLLIPLAALFFLGTVRVQSKRTNYPPPPVKVNTYPPAPPVAPRPQEAIVASVEATQSSLQKQRAELAQNVAKSQMEVEKRIAKMDIHELMDKVDAPRIALVPAVPEAPDAPRPPSSDKEENESPGTKATTEAALDAETTENASPAAAEERPSKENKTRKKEQNTRADDKDIEYEKQGNAEAPLPSTKEITDELAAKVIVRRPAWVDSQPTRTGEVVREVIATDAYVTANECYRAADVLLMLKTYERLQELNGSPYAEASLPSISFQNNAILADGTVIFHGYPGGGRWEDHRLFHLTRLGIGPEFVRREVVAKDPKTKQSCEYLEQSELSVGPMNNLFMQVEFSPAVDRLLRERWDAYARQERFAMVGKGAISILGLLGCVFGLLKIDTWTKGYYTKRLFIGVPAAIIGVFLIALLIDIAA
jgi:hypothetical protein